MQNRSGVHFLLIVCVWVVLLHSNPVFAALPDKVIITPEHIQVQLPQLPGVEYRVSSTLNPMKVIIDSTVPLTGFPGRTKVQDVVLREIRYSDYQGGGRLVLDFNYRVPEPELISSANCFYLEIEKTYVQTSERLVVPGVIYGHQRRADIFGPNVVNYLIVDTQKTGIRVSLALAQNKVFGSEHVSTMAERLGAVAAVNGAYFAGDGRPLGVFMIDGELISEPYANRTALGIGPGVLVMDRVDLKGYVWQEGSLFAEISGLNRARLQDELIVYTHNFGSRTNTNNFGWEVTVVDDVVTQIQAGNSKIPEGGFVLSGHGISKHLLADLKVGDQLAITLELNPPWEKLGVEQIIGGGPRLVRDGELYLTGGEEKFRDDVLKGRAPRTALGITADKKLLLVTVNGRQPNISVGMALAELGQLLLELGAEQAMNLDGGGSTTMVIHNLVLNLPSDGKERPVSNAIVVVPPGK